MGLLPQGPAFTPNEAPIALRRELRSCSQVLRKATFQQALQDFVLDGRGDEEHLEWISPHWLPRPGGIETQKRKDARQRTAVPKP